MTIGRNQGVPRPLMTMTPKGPIIIIIVVILADRSRKNGILIRIIGCFGVIVIRGPGAPLSFCMDIVF